MLSRRVYCKTPIGGILLRSDGHALTGVELGQEETPLPFGEEDEPDEILDEAKQQFQEYFSGKRRDFDLPLSLKGTSFQERVWRSLAEIPYGETISYAELASRVGQPKACRAVGSANGRNRLAVILPCHRVIAADGSLGGYGGGLFRKKWLLDHEQFVRR